MIGGIDIRLPTQAGMESIEVAARAIRQIWTHAVFEHGETGERYEYFSRIPFGEVSELFVYRDRVAADVWDERGAVPEGRNAMIHLLYDDRLLTVVIDEHNAEMDVIVGAVKSGLRDSLFYLPSEAA